MHAIPGDIFLEPCIHVQIVICLLKATVYNLLAEGHSVYKAQGHSKPIKVNTLRLRQNGCHVRDDIFRCIFLNENIWILTKISLNYVPYGLIDNMAALVQIMAWRQPGDKLLSELMMGKFGGAYVSLSASTN